MLELDRHFADRKVHYISQIALATLTLAVVLIFSDALANAAIVTAIASTTFLIFVNPGATMAEPRRIVGGHGVALVSALAFSVVLYTANLNELLAFTAVRDAAYAVAVGTAMLLMAVTNTEHAPAAGTVLGLVIEPWSLQVALSVAAAAIALAYASVLLRRFLVDLV